MNRNMLKVHASPLVIALFVAGAVAGCNRGPEAVAASNIIAAPPPVATLPLSDVPASAQNPAPPPSSLPAYAVPRQQVASPQDAYAFADRAANETYVFGDSPPDYTFNYQGVSPWVWQADNGYYAMVEPAQGGANYYYYAPGAYEPYYACDPDYCFGYQEGVLLVVYDRFGHPLPRWRQDQAWGDAGRFMMRGQTLWRAAHAGQHFAVPAAGWAAQRTVFAAHQNEMARSRQQDPAWAAYHNQSGDQATWGEERYRREAEASRVDEAANPALARHEREAASAAASAVGGATLMAQRAPSVTPPPPAQLARQARDYAARQAEAEAQFRSEEARVASIQAAQQQQAEAQEQVQRQAQLRVQMQVQQQAQVAAQMQVQRQAQAQALMQSQLARQMQVQNQVRIQGAARAMQPRPAPAPPPPAPLRQPHTMR